MNSDFNVKNGLLADLSSHTESYPSPAGRGTSEEIILRKRYIELANIFLQLKYNPEKGKILLMQSFLVEKRKQSVEVFYHNQAVVKGRVQDVGRDYMVLTRYFTKCWIPFSVISEVKLPYGAPEFANTHQYIFFDNQLRRKLLRNFGATVSNRSKLKELFYRETLKTSLSRWKNSRLKVEMLNGLVYSGKLVRSEDEQLLLITNNEEKVILYHEVKIIKKSRFM
ncbi:hypothetical protein ACFO0S_03960 [Chryseomicrobium palamuruense]|uniref:DUF2642 domain-containing protein n=1 Tax=Chryseomicrobium palamuruense TaxID=682973 RepID=A0ABV8USF7_9BACL